MPFSRRMWDRTMDLDVRFVYTPSHSRECVCYPLPAHLLSLPMHSSPTSSESNAAERERGLAYVEPVYLQAPSMRVLRVARA